MQVVEFGRGGRRAVAALKVFGLVACLLATSCVTTTPVPTADNATNVTKLFTDIFGGYYQAPLDVPDLGALAVAGLNNLGDVDRSVAARRQGNDIQVSLGGQEVRRFRQPPADAPRLWAEEVAAAFVALYERSPEMQARETNELYDLFEKGAAPLAGDGAWYRTEAEQAWLMDSESGRVDMLYQPVEQGIEILEFGVDNTLKDAGLRIGDVVTHVDGRRTAGYGGSWRRYVDRMMQGGRRSVAQLTVLREGEPEPMIVSAPRQYPHRSGWELDVRDGFVDFRLWHADFSAVRVLHGALSAYPEPESHWNLPDDFTLRGVLIDLRPGSKRPSERDFSNPTFAGALAALFLPRGTLVDRKRGRAELANSTGVSKGDDLIGNAPVVILVDGSTNGPSEILASALQGARRALVIGTATTGHGLVSLGGQFPSEGIQTSHGGILVVPGSEVIARGDYSIEGRGVMPNICTSSPEATLDGLLAELRAGKGVISEATRTRNVDRKDKQGIADFRKICPPVADSGDLAYELGVAIVTDAGLYARLMAGAGS